MWRDCGPVVVSDIVRAAFDPQGQLTVLARLAVARKSRVTFVVFESADQREVPASMTAEARTTLARFVRPVAPIRWDKKEKKFFTSAVIEYLRRLYHCDFSITPGGEVKMLDDFRLMNDLPPARIPPIGI